MTKSASSPQRHKQARVVSPYFSPPRRQHVQKLSDNVPASLPSIDSLLYELRQLKPALVQEQISDDPWKVLVAVNLLNKTTARVALPVFWKLIERWPSAFHLSQAPHDELKSLLFPLGTYSIRSERLISLSRVYLKDPPIYGDVRKSRSSGYPWTPISHYPGCGPYALDSYRIFCTAKDSTSREEWRTVTPSDKELIRYLKWKWACEERMQWHPSIGPSTAVTAEYLASLREELSVVES